MNIVILMLMTFINGRVVMKIGSERMLQIALGIQFSAGIWLAICGIFQLGLWPMAIGVAVFVGMMSTIGSNAGAAILERYPHMAGTANAVAGTMRFGIGSLVGAALSQVTLVTERPMLFSMAGCITCAVLIYYFFSYKNQS